MKTRLRFFWAIILMALFTSLAVADHIFVRQASVVCDDVAIPKCVTNIYTGVTIPRYSKHVTIQAKRGRGTLNVGNVYLGPSSTNDEQYYKLAPGEEMVIEATGSDDIDLSKWFMDGEILDDGILIWAH